MRRDGTVSTQSQRVDDALAYLHRVVTGDEPADATRVAAARALVTKDPRDAANDAPDVARGLRVLLPALEDEDDG